jgi:GNAT superfamily N-acetyltransferase
MRVEELSLENVENAYAYLHNPSPQSAFWQNFLPTSRLWLKQNLGRYVEGYHLMDDEKVVGHIYYAPSEKALIEYEIEPNVAFIYCVYLWKEHRHKGLGRKKCLNISRKKCRRKASRVFWWRQATFHDTCIILISKNLLVPHPTTKYTKPFRKR